MSKPVEPVLPASNGGSNFASASTVDLVAQARRAWLTKEQVANTRPWPEFAALHKRVRA